MFTNKVFCEIIVWPHVDLHILHTVTAWQATEWTKTDMKSLLSKTHLVSRDFINIYIGQMCDKPHIRQVYELSEWKAKCFKLHLHEKGWSLTNSKFNNSDVIIFIMIGIKQRQA